MSAAPAVDHYLLDVLLPALFPEATIVRGSPGTHVSQDVVALRSTSVEAAQVCMGPARRLDEQITVTVVLSCTRHGDASAQAAADDAAWAMLTALRDHLRAETTPNLGGTAQEARVSAYTLERPDDPALLEVARNATITATLTVRARN